MTPSPKTNDGGENDNVEVPVEPQTNDAELTGNRGKSVAPNNINTGFTPDILYDLLVANVARQRGENEVMVDALSRAAEKTRDTRVIAQATHDAIRADRLELGLKNARLWAEIEPDNAAPKGALAHIYLAMNEPESAYQQLEAMVLFAESDPGPTYRRIAELIGRQDDSAAILSIMDRLIALNPDVADAYYAKAYLAGRYQEFEIVDGALNQALQLKPGWELAGLAKISNFAAQKDKQKLTNYAETFLQEYPQADKFRLQFARYLVDQDADEEALKHFEEIANNHPDNADAVYAAGLLHLQLENFSRADHYLKQHLKLRANHDQTRLYLSETAYEQGNYDDAAQWLEAVADGQFRFDAELRLAGVIAKRDGLDAGLEYLDNMAPSSENEEVRVYLTQEQLLREENLLDQAKVLMDNALNKYPENTELLYSRGLILAQLKEVEGHERDLRKLIEKQPDNAHAYNALGYTLADLTDRLDEALSLITKALELKPNDPYILDSMGWVHYRMGRNSLALDYLQRAMEVREDAEIAAHLGEVLWVMGQQQQAKSVWQRGTEIGPENNVLRETIRKHTE